jgi:hypothetical protein
LSNQSVPEIIQTGYSTSNVVCLPQPFYEVKIGRIRDTWVTLENTDTKEVSHETIRQTSKKRTYDEAKTPFQRLLEKPFEDRNGGSRWGRPGPEGYHGSGGAETENGQGC